MKICGGATWTTLSEFVDAFGLSSDRRDSGKVWRIRNSNHKEETSGQHRHNALRGKAQPFFQFRLVLCLFLKPYDPSKVFFQEHSDILGVPCRGRARRTWHRMGGHRMGWQWESRLWSIFNGSFKPTCRWQGYFFPLPFKVKYLVDRDFSFVQ